MVNEVSNQVKFGITQKQVEWVSGQLEEKKKMDYVFQKTIVLEMLCNPIS